jgi:hypothetical protein
MKKVPMIQMRIMIQPELKKEAEAVVESDPIIESMAQFVRAAIAEKIKREQQ